MKGDLFINGNDAYLEYGLELSQGAISALICPPENKEMIRNESRLTPGAQYISAAAMESERTLTLEAHICAANLSAMFSRLNSIYGQAFKSGLFTLSIKELPGVLFRLKYNSFRQFSEFNGRLAVFALNVTEPDPTNRRP